MIAFLMVASAKSMALSDEIILKLVKEDISQGKVISGKTNVTSLKMGTCNDDSCLLDFVYDTSGCYQDYCYDLECSGQISFDLQTVESELKEQSCIDL
jgi:hypothetical protein